ncbi:MAG: hypothetical protein ACRDJN_31585 [Chloroflexota bacterium]
MDVVFAVLLAAVAATTVVLVLAPLRRPAVADLAAHELDDVDAELAEAREATIQALRDLDSDFELGKLGKGDYQTLRERYRRHAIALLKVTRERPASPNAPGEGEREAT